MFAVTAMDDILEMIFIGIAMAMIIGLLAFLTIQSIVVSRRVLRTSGDDRELTEEAREREELERRLCPECGYDLRASGDRCPECGALVWNWRCYAQRLANEWPSNPVECRRLLGNEEAVLLHSTANEWEATLLRDQLLARGIASFIQKLTAQGNPYRPSGHGRNEVFVYAPDLEDAQAYLRRVRDEPVNAGPIDTDET